MYVTTVQFKLKPGVEHSEAIDHFNNIMVPVYREFPACIGVRLFRYIWSWDDEQQDWDYAFVEVWENREAVDQAKRDGLVERQREVGVWAFGEKTEKSWMSGANLVASS